MISVSASVQPNDTALLIGPTTEWILESTGIGGIEYDTMRIDFKPILHE
jgi:hypothetical protein